MVEFTQRDLTGSRFKIVDLSNSRFSDLNLVAPCCGVSGPTGWSSTATSGA